MARHAPEETALAAHQFANLLAGIADQLDGASDAGSFVGALQANCRVWAEIGRLAPLVGWDVPMGQVEFAVSAMAPARHGIDDHDVEAMIRINRNLAEKLASANRTSPPQQSSLWREWLCRYAPEPAFERCVAR